MKKYKVTYEYRGKVTVDVECEDNQDPEVVGQDEADELISTCGYLHVYDVIVKEQ